MRRAPSDHLCGAAATGRVVLPPLPDRPLVSVVMPSYNQAAFLREALESVLAQTYRPIEILVMDGASTDGTVDVLRSYDAVPEVKYVSEPDRGVVDAVNKGFARVQGQIVGIQSSDDAYAAKDVVEQAVAAFRAHPDVGLVHGDITKVNASGEILYTTRFPAFTLEALLCKRTRIHQEAAFFRRALLDVVGGWREEVAYAADTDLFVRLAFRTRVLKVDRVFGLRRMHAGQRDEQSGKIMRAYWRMVDENPDIAALPARLRRAARAGKYLTAFRYNPSGSEWVRTYYLYRAKAAYPAAVSRREVPLRHWVPGYLPARIALSRVKRLVFRCLGRSPNPC